MREQEPRPTFEENQPNPHFSEENTFQRSSNARIWEGLATGGAFSETNFRSSNSSGITHFMETSDSSSQESELF